MTTSSDLLGSAPSPEERYEQRESVESAFTVANERSLRTGPLTVRWRFKRTRHDDRVSAITAFRLPEIFDRFGLPAAVIR